MNLRILLFAKEPELGRVKTRMAPQLSPEQSLVLHVALLEHVAENLSQWNLSPVEIFFWSADLSSGKTSTRPQKLSAIAAKYGFYLTPQVEGDLGKKMSAATAASFDKGCDTVLLLGADCPFLSETHLRQLFQYLQAGGDAAVIPAYDGGYVALALRRFDLEVFASVDWGTDRVLQQTMDNLRGLKWRYRCFEPLHDIDRPEDLALLGATSSPQLQGFQKI